MEDIQKGDVGNISRMALCTVPRQYSWMIAAAAPLSGMGHRIAVYIKWKTRPQTVQ